MTKHTKYILPDLMTVPETAALFRVTPLTLKKWAKLGTIPSVVINSRGDRRFRKEDVIKILENGFDL